MSGSTRLKTVALHITRVCGHNCSFCYLGDDNRNEHPPFGQIAQIIRELGRQRIEDLYLVGGDPCSYPHLLSTLQLARELGMRSTVLSNTLDFGGHLEEAMEYADAVETTILGPSSSEHDQETRRGGSYAALVRNIRQVNRLGIGVGVMFNATPATFDKLFLTMHTLQESLQLDVKYAMIQRIIPRGRAGSTLKYSVSVHQIRRLFQDIEKVSEELELPVVFEDPFPLCTVEEKYHGFLARCEWGFSKAAIDAEGNISRCGSDSRYQIGNIFHADLQSLWETSPILRSFRAYEWLPKRCQGCVLLQLCGGGCSLSRITDEDHAPDILLPDHRR